MMRDEAATTQTTTFDPAAHGWKHMKLKGFTELVGPIWARRNGENWSYAFLAGERHDNRQGAVHGGMLMTFADHAIGFVAWEAAGRRACVTMQLENQFLAPVRSGDFVECETEVVRAAKTVIFLRGVLKVRGRPVMAANGIWKVVE
ncbi:MAG: PaaI family thioesterase [Hyphomicrobiales bacterium]|nr:PaaI family thioesterase [Hyphomicrobiales bacterium]